VDAVPQALVLQPGFVLTAATMARPMRSFLGWVLLVAVLGGLAFLFAPIVARTLVADAVRAVSPFGSEPIDVEVDATAAGLLRGKVDSIRVTGANLAAGRLEIGNLDATATNIGILDRAFDSMTGTLGSVVLRRSDGSELRAREVQLSGPSDAVQATASVGPDAALRIVRQSLDGAGLPTGNAELVDGGVRLSVLGQQTTLALGAADGSVTIAGSVAGGSPIVVFGPEPGDPWRITGVSVSPDGLEVYATIDLAAVLAQP
jgi:hypothetical protein